MKFELKQNRNCNTIVSLDFRADLCIYSYISSQFHNENIAYCMNHTKVINTGFKTIMTFVTKCMLYTCVLLKGTGITVDAGRYRYLSVTLVECIEHVL